MDRINLARNDIARSFPVNEILKTKYLSLSFIIFVKWLLRHSTIPLYIPLLRYFKTYSWYGNNGQSLPNELTNENKLGLVMNILGGVIYTYIKHREKTKHLASTRRKSVENGHETINKRGSR